MDPSKRICLKNLPEGCTKREIADLVRNRTGTAIHSIDLGLDAEGGTRRYAHFSCEGAKHVLEVLSAGIVLRDSTIYAHPAKMHYSFRYAEARRKREREEADEKEHLDSFWAASKQRFLERTNGGELSMKKAPKDFYASKRKYALIAAEIAQVSRNVHAAANSSTRCAGHMRDAAYGTSSTAADNDVCCAYLGTSTDNVAAKTAAAAGEKRRTPAGGGGTNAAKKRPQRNTAAKSQAPPAAPPSPSPPVPTKEERKLSGLQAKLAALKEKLKK